MPNTLTSMKRWNSGTEASAIEAGVRTPIYTILECLSFERLVDVGRKFGVI